MLLVCERDALARELGRVVGVIERKATIPILQFVHLDAGAQAMMIRGTDLDMEVAAPCEADVKEQGVTCVDGRVLHDLIKKCQSGSVSLTLEEGGARLKIVAGRSRFSLPTLPPEDFPTLSGPASSARDGGRNFIVEAAELRALLGDTRFAMSSDETRFYLNGVYLHQDGEHLATVATDGHRLSARVAPLPAGADGMAGIILTRKLVGELLRALPNGGEVALEVDALRIAVTFAEVRIVSKLIEGTFPDYKRVIPTDPPHRVVVDRKRLAEAVERVGVVLEAKGGRGVGLTFDADGIEAKVEKSVLGMAFDALDALVEGKGAHLTIGFNHRYLLDILGAMDAETIVLRYGDQTGPVLIHADGEDGETHRMVLMPLRFNEVQKEAA